MKDKSKFWDKQAKNFSTGASEEIDECLQLAQGYLNDQMDVLDIGCGTGISTRKLSLIAKNVIGIDFSQKMIDMARQATIHEKNVEYLLASIEDDQDFGAFDIVIAFNVLHLVSNPEETLNKIHHLLKPEGLLISTTPCLGEKSYFFRLVFKILEKVGLLISVNPLTIKSLKHLIEESGLSIIDMKSISASDSNVYIVSKKLI